LYVKAWSVWLCVTPSEKVQLSLWMSRCGNVELLTDYLNAYDEVLSRYQPGEVVPFCRDQRFEDHLCLRPYGRWVDVGLVDNPVLYLYLSNRIQIIWSFKIYFWPQYYYWLPLDSHYQLSV
jgi:hypothetical protein